MQPEDHTVTIGAQAVTLERPRSYTVRWEIATAAAGLREGLLPRLLAAALGACWPDSAPWPGRRPSYEACRMDPLRYGAAVIDSLTESGAGMVQISHAGTKAFALLSGGLFGEREVREAEDFFGVRAEE